MLVVVVSVESEGDDGMGRNGRLVSLPTAAVATAVVELQAATATTLDAVSVFIMF